ncbi:MAG: peptidylprolyl isomerase, partial [Flavobacteriales bacterium]
LKHSAKLNAVPVDIIARWLDSEHPTVVTEALRALQDKDCRNLGSKVDLLSTSKIPSVSAAAWSMITSHDSTDHALELMQYIDTLSDAYLQSELIRNIEMSSTWIPFLCSHAISSKIPVIKTACVERVLAMTLEQNIDDFILALIQDGDPGCVAILIPDLIHHPHDQYEEIINKLVQFSQGLQLPEDLEVLLEIQKVTSSSEVRQFDSSPFMENNRLDWDFILSIPEKQVVEIRTTSGVFSIQLDVNSAPGSVSSFLKLVDHGYFNNKAFHRMVTNFVVQGGCPRGDGYGSASFILRSEFRNHRYRAGSVGLASAGKDTESCQWFVGLVPCLTLEGRYTIFGHVISGMEVVERLYVGSRILSIVRV